MPFLTGIAVDAYICLPLEAFNNHMDKKEWVGILKFAIFVQVLHIKNVHSGKRMFKKELNYVQVDIECPLCEVKRVFF